MPPSLLVSQFEALEPLGPDEQGLAVPVERPAEEVVAALLAGIARL
jgi:gluconokinase